MEHHLAKEPTFTEMHPFGGDDLEQTGRRWLEARGGHWTTTLSDQCRVADGVSFRIRLLV